ncbi:hypothetical protein J437_LFUL019761 [Ladona fulva]|nr:hypothetical protein J437_LFUL019761 [Ladona fulva]
MLIPFTLISIPHLLPIITILVNMSMVMTIMNLTSLGIESSGRGRKKKDGQMPALRTSQRNLSEYMKYKEQHLLQWPQTLDQGECLKKEVLVEIVCKGNICGQYVISGLSHDTSYLVRVAAKNAAGVGDFAEELHHRTGKITADSVTGESSSAISVHVPPNLLFQLFLQLVMLTVPLVSCRASMSVNL